MTSDQNPHATSTSSATKSSSRPRSFLKSLLCGFVWSVLWYVGIGLLPNHNPNVVGLMGSNNGGSTAIFGAVGPPLWMLVLYICIWPLGVLLVMRWLMRSAVVQQHEPK